MSATLLKRHSGEGASRAVARARRHFRVRKTVRGTAERPRLVVTRSLRHVTAQIVDDNRGHTLVWASSMDASIRGARSGQQAPRPDKKAVAAMVGTLVAERATAAGIGTVVFDRGGNRYAGRIASLADAARRAGLDF